MNNLLGPDVGITDLIQHHMVEKAEAEELLVKGGRSTRQPFRPSSAGECERALAYKAQEYNGDAYYDKPAPEAHVQLIFALGHAIEAMLIKIFSEVEFFETKYLQQVLTFFSIAPSDDKGTAEQLSLLIEGSNDGCFVGRIGEFKGVFDIKSKATGVGTYKRTKWAEYDDKFNKMNSIKAISPTSYWIDDPEAFIKEVNDPHLAMNIWQLNLYCLSDFMKQRGFNFGSLIYLSKDNCAMRELRFRPSQSLYDKVQVRFQSAYDAAFVNKPHLAKQEFLLGSTKCAYCPYVKPCWGTSPEQALQESFKSLPKKTWPVNLDRTDATMANILKDYHKLADVEVSRDNRAKELMEYMTTNKIDKVQVSADDGEKIVYELKRYKTTMSLKRSRV